MHCIGKLIVPAVVLVGMMGADLARAEIKTEGLTPEQTVEAVKQAVKEKQPAVFFKLLPASYQKKIQSLIQKSVDGTDAEVWNKTFDVLEKANTVLAKKKDLLMQMNPGMPAAQKKKASEAIDKTTKFLGTILKDSNLTDHAKAKKMDLEKFIASHGTDMMNGIEELMKANPDPNEPKSLAEAMDGKVTVGKVSNGKVTITYTKDGESETETMVQVEGKWIPEDLKEKFDEAMTKADAAVDQAVKQGKANKKMSLSMLGMVDDLLDKVGAAKSPMEVQMAVMQSPLMQIIAGMGGGGRPAPPGLPRG